VRIRPAGLSSVAEHSTLGSLHSLRGILRRDIGLAALNERLQHGAIVPDDSGVYLCSRASGSSWRGCFSLAQRNRNARA